MLPPGVRPVWDDNGVETKAQIVAFDQLCQFDEAKLASISPFGI